MKGKIFAMFAVFAMVLTGFAAMGSASAETPSITIVADHDFKGNYDYGISSDDISVDVKGDEITVTADIHNFGECWAWSAWGWYSSSGRSCWGEWDFTYPRTESVDISFMAADTHGTPTATYRIELDGKFLGSAHIPAPDTWYLITLNDVQMTEGEHTLFLGTYQMDSRPDVYIDYIKIGDMRIEAENYDRMGGNDPNADWRGLSVYPRDIAVQIWDGNPSTDGVKISEQLVGKTQLVIDSGHQYSGSRYYAHYIETNGIGTVTATWTKSVNTNEIYVVVDANNELKEVNEDNNIASKTAGIPAIPVTTDFDPDTLNLNSKGKWVTTYVELPEGYDVNDIDVGTILLNDVVPAEDHPTEIGDYDNDGVADLMVKFDRSAVQDILEPGDNVIITVAGELTDGTPFEGNDTIRVIE